MKVCNINWSEEWSKAVCQSLGYTETKTTTFRTSESAENPATHLKLKDDSTLNSSKSLVDCLEPTTASCDTVEIKCSSKHRKIMRVKISNNRIHVSNFFF